MLPVEHGGPSYRGDDRADSPFTRLSRSLWLLCPAPAERNEETSFGCGAGLFTILRHAAKASILPMFHLLQAAWQTIWNPQSPQRPR
jgi:hypothetical protein